MKRTCSRKPVTASDVHTPRHYSDMLIEMYEEGQVGSETMISLIEYFSDQDIEGFMRSEGLLDEEED